VCSSDLLEVPGRGPGRRAGPRVFKGLTSLKRISPFEYSHTVPLGSDLEPDPRKDPGNRQLDEVLGKQVEQSFPHDSRLAHPH